MSINTNRAKLNKAKTNKEYKAIKRMDYYGLYWDEGVSFYPKYNRGTSKDNKKFSRKTKMSYQYRMYKTWKHNRDKQWKEKNLFLNREEIII